MAGRSGSVRRLFYGMKNNLIDYPVDAVVFLVIPPSAAPAFRFSKNDFSH